MMKYLIILALMTMLCFPAQAQEGYGDNQAEYYNRQNAMQAENERQEMQDQQMRDEQRTEEQALEQQRQEDNARTPAQTLYDCAQTSSCAGVY